eukprot:jgi/Botrbrau1/23300/Bobra.0102s0041.1
MSRGGQGQLLCGLSIQQSNFLRRWKALCCGLCCARGFVNHSACEAFSVRLYIFSRRTCTALKVCHLFVKYTLGQLGPSIVSPIASWYILDPSNVAQTGTSPGHPSSLVPESSHS